MLLLEETVRKLLKEVDPDISEAMLRKDDTYYAWQLLQDPVNAILNWQLLRDRARYKDYPMVYGGAVNNSP